MYIFVILSGDYPRNDLNELSQKPKYGHDRLRHELVLFLHSLKTQTKLYSFYSWSLFKSDSDFFFKLNEQIRSFPGKNFAKQCEDIRPLLRDISFAKEIYFKIIQLKKMC